jgi:NAD(P)-dependent dehydrogenase (short-subunit alcohol dehydrogenase family)
LFLFVLLKGIGRATCIALAKHSAKVVLSDINFEEAQQTVKLIQAAYESYF